MQNLLKLMLQAYLQQHAQLPSAELNAALAATANYTSDGQPLTADQFMAAVSVYVLTLEGKALSQVGIK